MKKVVAIIALVLLSAASAGLFYKKALAPSFLQKNETKQPNKEEIAPGFDKSQYPLDEVGSPWIIINKKRPLPDGYVPSDLIVPDVRLRLGRGEEQMKFSQQAEPALKEMFAAASEDGVQLVFGSGYRSEKLQKSFYDSYVAQDGQAAADTYSARPGHSEHQTGLAFDATSTSGKCHLEECFKDMAEGKWLREHAHEYGFVVRYLEGKDSVTGYVYEPWHMRFVGKELAAEIHQTGQTLEGFFNLDPAPTY